MTISEIDESKATKFYNEIIREFDNHEEIFGELDDFKDFVKSSEVKEDGFAVPTKIANTSIYFQKELFENLFYPGFTQPSFDSKEGKLVIENKSYIELYLSPLFYPRENENNDINKDHEHIFFFIKGKGEIYYTSKVIPYFISTLKNRFVKKIVLEEREFDFYDFFKVIQGLIVINNEDFSGEEIENLEKNLKFQIAKKYGLIPIEEDVLTKKFTLPKGDVEIKTEVKSKTSIAIYYYLKGLGVTNVFYQFLNFYQVIEHYSIVYSLKYLSKKIETAEPREAHKTIKKMQGEEYLISFAVAYFLKDREGILKTVLDKLNQGSSVENLIERLNEICSNSNSIENYGNWQNDYAENLGRLIYKIRNEIVHTKRKKDILGELVSKHLDVFQYTVEVLKNVSEKAIEEDMGL